MAMPIPTFAEAKVKVGVPAKVTSSAFIIPCKTAVPVALAVVVAS
jgi:hypothetical protein